MKVAVIKTDMYRDGGTICALLTDGRTVYVDQRIGSETRGQLFNEYPSHMKSEIIEDKPLADLVVAIHTALVNYKNTRSAERSALNSTKAWEAHKAADLV